MNLLVNFFDTFIQRPYKESECKNCISVFHSSECSVIQVMWGSLTASVSWLWSHVNPHPNSFLVFLSLVPVSSSSVEYIHVYFFFSFSFLNHWIIYFFYYQHICSLFRDLIIQETQTIFFSCGYVGECGYIYRVPISEGCIRLSLVFSKSLKSLEKSAWKVKKRITNIEQWVLSTQDLNSLFQHVTAEK